MLDLGTDGAVHSPANGCHESSAVTGFNHHFMDHKASGSFAVGAGDTDDFDSPGWKAKKQLHHNRLAHVSPRLDFLKQPSRDNSFNQRPYAHRAILSAMERSDWLAALKMPPPGLIFFAPDYTKRVRLYSFPFFVFPRAS